MRLIRGRGGTVFLASAPLRFDGAELADCGDGFDWRSPDCALGLWCDDEPLRFERSCGGLWLPLEPLEVSHLTGRVAFGRCLRGQRVRVSGLCRPLAEVVCGTEWTLLVEIPINDTTGLSDDHATSVAATDARTARCELSGCTMNRYLGSELEGSDLLVRLPYRLRVFAGVGKRASGPLADEDAVTVSLNEGKVRYVNA